MSELKTYAVRVATPCCNELVMMCWRLKEQEVGRMLTWTGIPCPTCEDTFVYEMSFINADKSPAKFEIPNLNPGFEEMICWGMEGMPDWAEEDE